MLLGALAAAGCAATTPRALVDDPAVRHVAVQALAAGPARSAMSHKVSVRVAGRDLVLTGYMVLDHERGLRAVAVDEYGGPVLGFAACRDGAVVDLAPPRVSAEIVRRGPQRDLRLVFLPPASTPELVEYRDGRALLSWTDDGSRVEATVDLERGCVVGLVERRGRRLVREITLEPGPARAGSGAVPAAITVDSRALHYRARYELLEVEAVTDPQALEAVAICPEIP